MGLGALVTGLSPKSVTQYADAKDQTRLITCGIDPRQMQI